MAYVPKQGPIFFTSSTKWLDYFCLIESYISRLVQFFYNLYQAKKKKKNVLSQSSRAHSFFFARPFVLRWQIFFLHFFKTFLSKITSLLTNMKNQNANISRPALSDSNLILSQLPSQFSSPFLAIQTNCTGRQWFQQVVKKKKKNVFCIPFWNAGEQMIFRHQSVWSRPPKALLIAAIFSANLQTVGKGQPSELYY